MTSRKDSPQAIESVERFSHQRLKLADSMRVLELQPALHSNSTIRCRLKEVILKEAHGTYEALSYVWGSPGNRKDILCDNKRLAVTINCWTALVSLRRRFRTRFLWVDAICIDQTGHDEALKERGEQVQKMGNIYNCASKVLLWFGPGNHLTTETFLVLNSLYKLRKLSKRLKPFLPGSGSIYDSTVFKVLSRSLNETVLSYDEVLSKDEEDLTTAFLHRPAGKYNAEIVAILEHPWFTRVWTLQEHALARECDIYRGKSSMGWAEFSSLVGWLGVGWARDQSSLLLIYGRNGLDDLIYDELDARSKPNEIDPGQTGSEESSSSYQELLFLSSMMNHQATVPIDKVYSVYTILTLLNIPLTDPDYNKPPLEAYQELTESWIRSKKKLSIIALSVQHGLDDDSPAASGRARPSWVPDWGISDAGIPDSHNFGMPGCSGFIELLDRRMHQEYPCYASSTSSLDPDGAFRSTGMLSVRGISIGCIKERFAIDSTDKPMPNNDSNTFNEAFQRMCRHISIMPTKSYPTGEDPVTAFLYCATYKNGQRRVDRQDFENYFDLMLYPNCTDKDISELIESKSSCEAPDRLMDFLDALPLMQLESSDHRAELRRLWGMQVVCDTPDHAFFIMESGYFGSAFRSAQLNDEVFLLAGCPWPMVLRQCAGGYKFIAPAYVHGVMDGERWPADTRSLMDINII